MMLAQMLTAITAADNGGGNGFLLLLGPGAGGLVYFGLWNYYRNARKSHAFERETRVTTQPPTGTDAKVNEVRGTKRTRIDGANNTDHRERVRRM